jgi:hypothetical protein
MFLTQRPEDTQSSQRKKVKKCAKLESRQDDIMETFSPVFLKNRF